MRPVVAHQGVRGLILGGAITLGLLVGGGVAWAYWAASGTASGPGPLTSATLDLQVTGPSGTLAGPGGTVALTDLSLAGAVPGGGDSEVFTVRSAGTVASLEPSATAAGSGALGPYLVTTVLWGGTDAGATCTGGTTTAPVLAPGGETTVCVAVALSPTAPSSAQGLAGGVTLTLTGTRESWTDTGDVTSGTFTAWALTGVTCPAPAWGSNHALTWSQPSGTAVASVALDASSPPVTGLTSWQPAPAAAPGRNDTDGSPATWGITTSNLLETADFHGTWQVVASAPTVSGASAWTATRSGTWAINFDTSLTGTTACAVTP